MVLDKIHQRPLNCKGIKPVIPKRNHPWVIWKDWTKGPVFWPHDAKRGWQIMRWLYGITDSMDMSLSKPGNNEWQGNLACCSPQSHKKSDMTMQLNNNMKHPLIKVFDFSYLLQVLNSHRMVDAFFVIFLCSCKGSALMIVSTSHHPLLMAGHCTP